jgi:hypothetical protein
MPPRQASREHFRNQLDPKLDCEVTGIYQPRWNATPTATLPVVSRHEGD